MQIAVPGTLSFVALIFTIGSGVQSPNGALPPSVPTTDQRVALGFQPGHVYAVSGLDQTLPYGNVAVGIGP
ncbi:MAG TPA: hypothetical protein VKT72_11710 [Candidatus Baltobacteraceae bacterium]|nr:hypothetical protein [Candidatus Baltobacteraceae bacterium]